LTKLVPKVTNHRFVHDAHLATHWHDDLPSAPRKVDDHLPDLATNRVIDHQAIVVIAEAQMSASPSVVSIRPKPSLTGPANSGVMIVIAAARSPGVPSPSRNPCKKISKLTAK